MLLLHESTVLPEEIDSLGHMNVRYYMARMEAANRRLLADLGVNLEHYLLRRIDTYTRFHREQFTGATLHALGGVLELTEVGMQSYVEIRNPAQNEVAASFIVSTALVDPATRHLTSPDAAANTHGNTALTIPEYAQPRSLDLEPVQSDITLERLRAEIPDVEGGGMLSGRRAARVEAADVDDHGWLREDIEVMYLPFAREQQNAQETQGPPVFTGDDGQRVGWAVMETRTVRFAQPRQGTELAFFSADIDLQEKSRLSRRWALDATTGELLGISDNVGVCIDLDARRAIGWPATLRSEIERHLRPGLAQPR